MKSGIIAIMAGLTMIMASITSAQNQDPFVPTNINFQAFFTDNPAQGQPKPLEGPYDFTFRIYDNANGTGDPLWTEPHPNMNVKYGEVNVILGSTTALTTNHFRWPPVAGNQDRWLEVLVDNVRASMLPIVSAPYAYRASDAYLLGGSNTTAFLFRSGGTMIGDLIMQAPAVIRLEDTAGDDYQIIAAGNNFTIGEIGVAAPRLTIDTDGEVGIGAADPLEDLHIASGTPGVRFEDTAGDDYEIIADGNNFTIGEVGVAVPRLRIDTDGEVGIGAADPLEDLHIASGTPGVRFEDTGGDDYQIIADGNNFTIGEVGVAAARLTIDTDGEVGIGTVTPATPLDVNGATTIRGNLDMEGNEVRDVNRIQVNTDAGAGRVLTSDANGNGTWGNLPAEADPTVTAAWVKDGVTWDELKGQGMPAGFADDVDGVDLAYDGSLRLGAPAGASVFIDSDNNSAGEAFRILHDSGYHGEAAADLFTINESGAAFISGSLDVRSLDVRGDIQIPAGNSLRSTSGNSLRLNAPGSVDIFIDNDNNSGSESFGVYHNNAAHFSPLTPLFTINEAGTAYINGNFGIGITPHFAAKLDVNGHAAIRGALAVGWSPPPDFNAQAIEDEYQGIRLGVVGNVYVEGKVYVNKALVHSDDRLKFNEQKLDYGLAQVMALEPKRYDQAEWEYDPETEDIVIHPEITTNEIGLVAQDVQKVIPEAVSVPKNENARVWSLSYDTLIPVLIKAIQEQQAQIEELKKEIQAIKSGIQS